MVWYDQATMGASIRSQIALTSTYPRDLFRRAHRDTVEAGLTWAVAEGYWVRKKTQDAISPGTGTVAPGGILLPARWDEMNIKQKAGLLVHEISHLRDRKYMAHVGRWGLLWYARYPWPWRLTIAECRGYGAQYAYRQFGGATDHTLRSLIAGTPTRLRAGYLPTKLINITKRQRRRFNDRIVDGLSDALGV